MVQGSLSEQTVCGCLRAQGEAGGRLEELRPLPGTGGVEVRWGPGESSLGCGRSRRT